MAECTSSWISKHVRIVEQMTECSDHLPFADLLSAESVDAVMSELKVGWRECDYTPAVTLWTFLSQVLSTDHSCRNAVSRLRAHQVATGQLPVQPDTSPYCKARKRLPENLLHTLATKAGRELHQLNPGTELLQGRSILIADGTTLSMPDTPQNQREYPQPESQKPGLGFPIARAVGLIGWASGAILDLAIGPYTGKETGEMALLRQLLRQLKNGDILVADRYYGSYWMIASLKMQGIDCIFPLHARRTCDFRRGRRLGRHEHIVTWVRPQRPNWMSKKLYSQMPPELRIREFEVQIAEDDLTRKQDFVLVTTLTDRESYPREEITQTYRFRWDSEVDLRSIKYTMQMDILRCKSPEMVRKEVWTHILAYNLVRTVMQEASVKHEVIAREISFKATLQAINSFREVITQAAPPIRPRLYVAMLQEISENLVRDRPNRNEPRAIKRDPKKYPYLSEPRRIARNYVYTSS